MIEVRKHDEIAESFQAALIRARSPADNSRMSMHPPPQIFKRIGITLGLGVAFIVMASIFSPDRTRAANDGLSPREPRTSLRARDDGDNAASTNAHEGLNSLGEIESGRYVIAIYSTDLGPRYTILARDSGEELGTLLSAAQVEQLLPEIDLKAMDFSTPSEDGPQQLMLTEPQG